MYLYWCICCAGAVESDYVVDTEGIDCDSMLDSSQQVSSDADVSVHSVGKITFVQCSAGSAKSVDDVSLDSVPGMYDCSSNKHLCTSALCYKNVV